MSTKTVTVSSKTSAFEDIVTNNVVSITYVDGSLVLTTKEPAHDGSAVFSTKWDASDIEITIS